MRCSPRWPARSSMSGHRPAVRLSSPSTVWALTRKAISGCRTHHNDRFRILAPDGAYVETWGIPGDAEGEFEFYSPHTNFGHPYGDVAFDAAGNIYVIDTGNFRVQKFAPDRTFLLAWGSEGEGDGQFLAAGSIAVAGDGAVYVADETRNDVQKFDGRGAMAGHDRQRG